MKRYIVIPAVAVVVLGALVLAPGFVDWNRYKEQAQTQISTMTGHDVQLRGDISLAILPSPRVYVADVFVKDPASPDAALATLGRLDVRVALLPLLGGEVAINSIYLEKPDIRLSKDANGRFNFMTPELEALGEKKGEAQDKSKEGAFLVSFKQIGVKGGSFSYAEAGKEPMKIEGINLDVEADAINGPFDVKGAFVYGGHPVEIDAKTGRYDAQAQSASLNLKGRFGGLDMTYAGVVSAGEQPGVQGEASVAVASLPDFLKQNGVQAPPSLKGELEVKGFLTADTQAASLKNAELKLAGQSLSGSVEAGFSPISLDAAFKGSDTLDLDRFIGGASGGQKPKTQGNPIDLAAILPQTLELPALGGVRIELSVPAAVLNGQTLKDVRLSLSKAEKGFKTHISAGDIPGGGAVVAQASLDYGKKSQKGEKEVYADPSAAFSLKGESRDMPGMVQAFTGMRDLPLIRSTKTGLFDIAGQVEPGALIIDRGVINLDKAAYGVSGALQKQAGTDRQLLRLKILADSMDFDSLGGGGKSASSGGDPLEPLKTLNLPYDVAADVTINSATLQGHEVDGVRVAATLRPNTLVMDDVSARSFAGSALGVKGKIGDLKNLSGVDVSLSVNSPDPYRLGSALKIDTSGWPKNLGAVRADVKATGGVSALDVNALVRAMNGEIIFKGGVADPLTQAVLSNVALQVKHPNMAQALGNLGVSVPQGGSFSGPVDFYTNVDMGGKVVTLRGIKASFSGSPATGDLRYDASGAVPSVTGALKFGRLVFQNDAKSGAAAQAGRSNPAAAAGGGKWSTAPIQTGWMHAMNAGVDVSADSILYGTWDMKSPSLRLSLQNGALEISDLKAGLFDGDIAAHIGLSSPAKGGNLSVKSSAKITSVNLGALAYALSGSRRIEAEGDASLNFDVSGAGSSQSAIVSSLSGKADLQGRKVVMKGFDLAALATALMDSNKPLDRLQEVVGASTSGGQTAFDTVDGRYDISGGQVNIVSMTMDGPAAHIGSSGHASLPRWYIDTVHKVTLKNAREVAPFDVVIRGPLDNPGNTFGKGMFESVLRQKVQDKVMEKLPDVLGKDVNEKLQKFGILPQAKPAAQQPPVVQPPATEPASGPAQDAPEARQPAPAEAQPAPAPAPQPPATPEDQAKEAIRGVLGDLLR